MRKSSVYLLAVAALASVLGGLLAYAAAGRQEALEAIDRKAAVVAQLGLTDLCLFTEARYTRNPSQADLSTPFQDHPVSLEHFPAGSLVPPPPALRGGR